MSFNIILYKTIDPSNKLDKSLTNAITLTGTLRDGCSVISPKITIESSTNISQYNYAYIEEFNRYYFITGIDVVRNNLWSLSMKIDVLMSYNASIKQLDVIVNRSASNWNALLTDPEFITQANTRIRTKTFGYTFQPTQNSYVLTVVSPYYNA